MKFGVFDHLDRNDLPLRDYYESRLKIAEAYDQHGFYAYHIAEHHSTPLGMAASRACFWRRSHSAPNACGLGRWSMRCRSIIRCG